MAIPPLLLDAPYSASLTQEPGWRDAVAALEELLAEREVLHQGIERDVYVQLEFVDGNPSSMGIHSDPSFRITNYPNRYNTYLWEVFEGTLCPTLAEKPMHLAMFRYKDGNWQVARIFDSYKETWNVWRASRKQFKSDRQAWFRQLATDNFEIVHEINLFIMIDQKTTEQKIVPLLIGLDDKVVWMMTNGLSDKLNPYSGNNWAELPSCNAEVLFRATRAQLGDAANSVRGLTDSLEVGAITQVAEAFYWRYVDGLEKRTESPDVDFSKPQRLQTLSEHTGSTQALETSTPFLLTRFTENGPLMLSDGRDVTPALVTIEGSLSSRLNPAVSSIVKTMTRKLGKAPKEFAGPSDADLFTLLREEIVAKGSIQAQLLMKRMQNYAALEFHYGRFLPEDLAPHLDYLYLLEFGSASLLHARQQVQKYPEFDPNLHEKPLSERPPLEVLNAYEGLKKLDLRSSRLDNLDWFTSVAWLEEILLSDTNVEDISPLADAPFLRSLDLAQTNIKDLAPLTTLHKLEHLILHGVEIEDISQLSALTNLKTLNVSHMPIKDISCLASLPKLEEVLLAGIDDIKDYSVLSSLPNLRLLSIAQTRIDDLSVLPDIPKLETLYLWDCVNVKDISALDRYANLKPVNTRGTGAVHT